MNKLAPLFLALALAFGVFGAFQHHQAKALRKQVAKLEAEVAAARQDAEARAGQLEKLTAQTESQHAAIEQLESRNRELAKNPPAAAAGQPAAPSVDGNKMMKGIAEMWKDPKIRETMRSQQIAQVNLMYGGLAEELGLAPDVARQVLALIGDRQADQADRQMAAMSRDGGDLASTAKESMAVRGPYDEQLKAILGEEGFKKLKDYETTLGERVALDQIQRQLAAGGTKLDDTQQKSLLQIMKEERQRANATLPQSAVSGNPNRFLNDEAAMEQWFTAQETMNRRVTDRAREVLSADQILAFDAAQKQFLDLQRMGMRMGRQMLQKK